MVSRQLWQPLRGAEKGHDQCNCMMACPCGGPQEGGASPASMPLLLPCPRTAKGAIKIGVSQRLEITPDERDVGSTCPWCSTRRVHVSPGCVLCGEGR